MLTPKHLLLTLFFLSFTLVAPDALPAAQAQELKFPETVTLKDRGEETLTPTPPVTDCKLQPLENEFVTFTPAADGLSGTLKAKDKGLTTSGNQVTIKLKCKKEAAPAAPATGTSAAPATPTPAPTPSELESNNIVVKVEPKARNLRVEIVRKMESGKDKADPIPPDNTLQLLQNETPKVRVVYDANSTRGRLKSPHQPVSAAVRDSLLSMSRTIAA